MNPLEAENKRKELNSQLDRLESMINELRVQYEQFFVDVLPQPPDELRDEVLRLIRRLLKAPFKNSADRFRLRTLVQRFQTYGTYWERVNKQREEGVYFRDVFKAELRDKLDEEQGSKEHAAEKSIKQLYEVYQSALKKTGGSGNVDFKSFKSSLLKQAQELREKQGVKKLHYKICIKDGRVVIKASKGENS